MGIKLERIALEDGNRMTGPVIRCDICGHVLSEDKRPGVYVYKNWTDEPVSITYACKFKRNGCHDKAEASIGVSAGWLDIKEFVSYIGHNYSTAPTLHGE